MNILAVAAETTIFILLLLCLRVHHHDHLRVPLRVRRGRHCNAAVAALYCIHIRIHNSTYIYTDARVCACQIHQLSFSDPSSFHMT